MNRNKSKYYLGTRMLKGKLLGIQCVRKNIQWPFLLCFGVYTPTQYALSCKIPKWFYANRKKPKSYLGAPKLKENGYVYILLEKIYNPLFYSVLEYIHQLILLSHVKYQNSNFTRFEKI